MASKHMVICEECGRRFNANYGGYYNRKTRRYTCPQCGKAERADARQALTGMRQSKVAMALKIIFGVLFVAAGFSSPSEGWSFGYFLTALAIGGALLAWGLVPYVKAKKAEKMKEEELREIDEFLANAPRTCPHCGARTKGNFCEYCGSPLE